VLYNSILDQEQIRECSHISNTIRNIPGTALSWVRRMCISGCWFTEKCP